MPGIVRSRVTTGSASARARSSRSRSAMRALDRAHFLMDAREHVAQMHRQRRRPHPRGSRARPAAAARAPAGSRDPVLAQEPAQRIDARRPRRHPLLAHPVHRDQRLLLDALHRHAGHLAPSARLRGSPRHPRGPSCCDGRTAARTPAARASRDGPAAARPGPNSAPSRTPPSRRASPASAARNRVNCARFSRWRATTRHCAFAIASSNTDFARSTATVVASISVSSWLR